MLIMLVLASILVYSFIYWGLYFSGVQRVFTGLMNVRVVDAAGGLAVYFFFYYAYFHQVVVFDRSVTPRMMVELHQSLAGKLTLEEIKSRYSLENKVKKELEDMDIMDRILKKDGYYVNTKKGLAHAKIIHALRDYLHIGGHQ